VFADGAAQHDQLAARVAARLEQDRVHDCLWLDQARLRLRGLGQADLGA